MVHQTYSNRDCKNLSSTRTNRLRRGHFHFAVMSLSLLIGAAALLGPTEEAVATRETTKPLTEPLPIPQPLAVNIVPTAQPAPELTTVVVKAGDSLASIFERLELEPAVLHKVLDSGPAAKELKRLLPGEQLSFDLVGNHLRGLNYSIDRTKTLAVKATDSGFTAKLQERAPEVRIAYAQGEIKSSLFAAGLEAGLSEGVVMELANIFGWDIDFALDIRAGDRFALLYEELYLDGERLGNGAIVAAEFVNQGNVFRGVRFVDPQGRVEYFSPDGRSMRKAFLRSPVDFRRISSGFQRERYHPVLGVKRPHNGVDYAAAIGTPVKAAGDGKVIFVGNKGGYGRTLIIQHGSQYSTLYAHLSRYQRGVKVGARIRQGQTIGYVGKSGLATGPHLHYEFRVNGAHRNPLTVKLPSAEPIKTEYRMAFQAQARELVSRLQVVREANLVAASNL